MLAAPNCPKCLHAMEPHEHFPVWWCDECQVMLTPEEAPTEF
jgi:hypothetical protein